jgi:hypothetical protein
MGSCFSYAAATDGEFPYTPIRDVKKLPVMDADHKALPSIEIVDTDEILPAYVAPALTPLQTHVAAQNARYVVEALPQ